VASQTDVSGQIIAALQVTAPDMDTSVGSVARKMIDAFSSAVADASVDTHLLTYQYDIYSHTGADLDAFVQLFGMSRFPATQATGTLTFTRGTATDVVGVPVGSQVSDDGGDIIVSTLTPGIFNVGVSVVTVPAQCTTLGPTGNAAANTLTQMTTPVAEVTHVTNLTAFTGGADQETDSQLQ
jgi:uncharacterized phage protein gp47/JayE